ncbi:MAG: 4Fe-4S dicluster domain-containing protein [Gaiellaceae bacterium]
MSPSQTSRGIVPADYPPPFSPAEAIAAPSDPVDERIEVGVLIVGAGPAGLACAIRLGQLLEDSPETAERLGDVPVAVVEKGKQPGSHLLSGAVVNPRALRRLFKGRPEQLEQAPTYGDVHGEAVYILTKGTSSRIPPPPTMRNHSNMLVSVAQLGRFLGEQAEAIGAAILPETDAQKLLVADGRVQGIRTCDKGRGREGNELGNFEAGSDIVARVTVLAEGTQGHLTGAAISRFGLEGSDPQVWALGVKEVWKVEQPLGHIVHTMGWPLRKRARFGEFGGSFIYPMGDDHVPIGFVAGLEYRDVEFSVHDVLQEFKTHRLVRKILRGGERVGWGAKTITEGGFHALPKRFNAPGLLLVGEGAGLVNVPTLKGIHYGIESGIMAAEAAFRSLQRGESPSRVGALDSYDEELRASYVLEDLRQVRNMRQVFDKGFFFGGAFASAMTITKGKLPPKDYHSEPNATHSLLRTDRARSYPAPDGKLTFDKLSSVFLSGNRTRDDQPNHIRIERQVPRELAELWTNMCPAQVYEVGGADGDGTVTVNLAPSNCVQCGAITAKGGRLTPPEGGSGPEYKLT